MTQNQSGYLALILHAHLPYVRHLEYDDALEERWLYEAITETYIPLLLMMDTLVEDNIDFRLTFSITPPLACMLKDPFLLSRYQKRLEGLLDLAESEVTRTQKDKKLHRLAHFYQQQLKATYDAFLNRYEKDLIKAFKRLQDMGKIEIIASAATHGYLPLLAAVPQAVRGQVQIGVQQYKQMFDCTPKGFWLPECAYSREIDTHLAAAQIQYSILETNGVTRANPRPEFGVHAPITSENGTVFFGRDPHASQQVWSSEIGYPGDYDYREFYRDISFDLDHKYIEQFVHKNSLATDTGFKYYRITGSTEDKELYNPALAHKKAALHADNFLSTRLIQIKTIAETMHSPPLIVAPYDAELFGHWWYEGPVWLDKLIRKVSSGQHGTRLTTLSEYLQRFPENQVCNPSASSWGKNGSHENWINERNDWIYPHLHQAALSLSELLNMTTRPDGLVRRALKQAVRELLLCQSSDWAFMINADKTPHYAIQRTKSHLMNFQQLKESVTKGTIDADWLTMIECRNNIFSNIDIDSFR